jgi:hypothetical protein
MIPRIGRRHRDAGALGSTTRLSLTAIPGETLAQTAGLHPGAVVFQPSDPSFNLSDEPFSSSRLTIAKPRARGGHFEMTTLSMTRPEWAIFWIVEVLGFGSLGQKTASCSCGVR